MHSHVPITYSPASTAIDSVEPADACLSWYQFLDPNRWTETEQKATDKTVTDVHSRRGISMVHMDQDDTEQTGTSPEFTEIYKKNEPYFDEQLFTPQKWFQHPGTETQNDQDWQSTPAQQPETKSFALVTVQQSPEHQTACRVKLEIITRNRRTARTGYHSQKHRTRTQTGTGVEHCVRNRRADTGILTVQTQNWTCEPAYGRNPAAAAANNDRMSRRTARNSQQTR